MKNIIILLFIIPLLGISQKELQVSETDSTIVIDELVTIDKSQVERYVQEDSIATILNIAYTDSVSIVIDSVLIDSVNYRLDTTYVTSQIESGFDTSYQTFQIQVRQDITLDSLVLESLIAVQEKQDRRIERGQRAIDRVRNNQISKAQEIKQALNPLIRITGRRGYAKIITEVVSEDDKDTNLAQRIRDLFIDEDSLSRASALQLRTWIEALGGTYTDRDQAAAYIWISE